MIGSAVERNAVTVVIPTFNRRKRLQNAVESVLKETRVPIKVHIFDNASTDDTEDYARAAAALDPRISYVRNDYNCGASENYTRGLASVKTKYYILLADDDWLLPNFIFDAFHILEQHRDAGAAIFVTEQRNENGEIECTYPIALDKIRFGLLTPREHLRDWMTYGHYGWSSILWRSETLKHIGAPYFFVGMPSDVDFQVQIFCEFSVYIVNRPGAVYLQHEGQASRGFDISTLPCWALLFKRLDRKVRNLRIFELHEYLTLRESMQSFYKPNWSRPSKSTLNDRQIIAIATLAGFRLGDWGLAFALLDQLKSGMPNIRPFSLGGSQMPLLPGDAGAQNGDPEEIFEGRGGLCLFVMLWFKNSGQMIDLLSKEVSKLKEGNSVLERQHEIDESRISELKSELSQTKAELALVEEHRDSLLKSTSWRVTSPLRYAKRLVWRVR